MHSPFEGLAGIGVVGGLPGEVLPALHDDVAVDRVHFHEAGVPAEALGGDQGAAAAAEGVEDLVAAGAAVLEHVRDEGDGLHGRVVAVALGLSSRMTVVLRALRKRRASLSSSPLSMALRSGASSMTVFLLKSPNQRWAAPGFQP
jgi:hypothetical protein